MEEKRLYNKKKELTYGTSISNLPIYTWDECKFTNIYIYISLKSEKNINFIIILFFIKKSPISS